MKNIDAKTAAMVWDRVQNTAVPAGDAPAILNLIEEELMDAAAYLRLARKLPPSQAAIARQLSQQEQAHAVCLKGIYTLITGRKAMVPQPMLSDDPPEVVLRRCYGREMRCLAQYEARHFGDFGGTGKIKITPVLRPGCHAYLLALGLRTFFIL